MNLAPALAVGGAHVADNVDRIVAPASEVAVLHVDAFDGLLTRHLGREVVHALRCSLALGWWRQVFFRFFGDVLVFLEDRLGDVDDLTAIKLRLVASLMQVVQRDGVGEGVGRARHVLRRAAHDSLAPHLVLVRSPRPDDLSLLGLG